MSSGGIPIGTVLTYQGTWPGDVFLGTANSILEAVTQALTKDGFIVLSSSANRSIVSFIEGGSFDVTLQLQVQNGLGFAQAADIIAIIRHEVFIATGDFPSADAIPNIGLPSTQETPTPSIPGRHGATRDCVDCADTDCNRSWLSSLGCSFGSFFGNLESKAGISIGLVGIGIVLAVILIFRFGRRE